MAAATQIEVGFATQAAEAATARPTAASATARNNFAALRLIAAVLVVYGHQTIDQTGTFGLRLVVFFAISGFLVAGSWHADPHLLRFMARRLLRIWPAYAAVVVVCAAVSYLFPSPDMPEISRLASMFYLSNLWFSGFEWGFFPFRNPFMNQSIWMMRFEVDIYIVFGLIAWFGARLGRRWLPLIAAGLVLTALRAPETHPSPGGLLECWSLYFAGFFAFGVLLREFAWMRRGVVVLLCIAAGVALLWLGERTAGLLLVIPSAAVWVGERSWPVLRSAGRFGDLSLGIFLWAWPMQQVTRLWLDPALPLAVQFTVVLLQVVAIACFSWRFIEAPALRCKPAKPARRKDFDDLVTA